MIDAVVKVGGGLLPHAEHLDAVLATIGAVAHDRRLLIVPGGGSFADSVREADRQLGLSGDAAHWMAILAMDQHAHLIADRLIDAVLVKGPNAIRAALDGRKLPVLAPFQWMSAADPLPHTWNVTSDSIAAWVAGKVAARKLVLVKPPGVPGGGAEVVDPYFARAIPDGLEVVILGADRQAELRMQLFG